VKPEELEGASLPELTEYLASEDARLRSDAACALGDRIRSRELKEVSIELREKVASLLKDAEPSVRFEAAITLAELHDNRARDMLLEGLTSRHVRLDATRALGTLGDASAAPELRTMLHNWMMPWADKLQAAAALCALHDPEGQEYLVAKLQSRKKAERAAAIHFIGESRHPDALATLTRILADRDDWMREVAARTMGLLGDIRARPALLEAREGAYAELKADIDQALEQLS